MTGGAPKTSTSKTSTGKIINFPKHKLSITYLHQEQSQLKFDFIQLYSLHFRFDQSMPIKN